MTAETAASAPLLEVRDLAVEYRLGGELFGSGRRCRAVDGVSLAIGKGKTLGLVGESGSGKSTVGRAIVGLAPVAAGSIRYAGREIAHLGGAERRALARRVQILFQDPYNSLNPRMAVGEAVWEAPCAAGLGQWRARRRELAAALFARVGLGAEALGRYPHEFSGGQRQRIALARALALEPEMIVLDEPTSALDVSMAAQVLNLLADLQAERALAYLLIGHDLAAVERVADEIAVLYAGQIVERSAAARLLAHPAHPYTQMLLEAARGGARIPAGEIPAGGALPPGCRFAPRCPRQAAECAGRPVELVETSPGHAVRCLRLD